MLGMEGIPSPGPSTALPSGAPSGEQPATSDFSAFAAQYGGGAPSAGGGAGTAGQNPMWLYLGTHTQGFGTDYMDHGYKSTENTQVKLLTAADQLARFEKMNTRKQLHMLRLLAIGGFTSSTIPLNKVDEFVKGASLDDAIAAYSNLLATASSYFTRNGQFVNAGDALAYGLHVTPEDVLRSRVAYRLKAAGVKWDGNLHALDSAKLADQLDAAIDASLDHGPKTITSTEKSLDFLNPADAKALVRNTLQDQLGRDPTQAEYEDFLAAIHAAERQDPSTRTTTTTLDYNADTNRYQTTGSSSTTHQGIGAAGLQELATERAQQQPGWAEWQAMGTYAPALFAALGEAIPGA